MSPLNGENSNPSEHTTNGLNSSSSRNGKSSHTNGNHNGLNNNHDEYNMDMKTNGNDKLAEDDPLTEPRKWDVMESTSETGQARFLQKFASTKFFMVIFLFAYVLQGCYFTYFVSVITTIEKLFHIKSASIALLLNFSEIGQIVTSLLLTYFAGRGHRPRWIACGMFLFSIAAFGSVSPHYIFGSRLYNHDVGATKQVRLGSADETSIPEIALNTSLCLTDEAFLNLTDFDPTCNDNTNQETDTDLKSVALVIFAVSLLGIGIGQTAIATLGIPYIDDNVKSKQSPMYMAITIGVRVLGPALGYYLGSYCIRRYVVLNMNVDHTDQNFIGAWWLGLLIVSVSMFFASLVMFTFSKNLRNKSSPSPITKLEESTKTDKKRLNGSGKLDDMTESSSRSKIKDFATTIKRQLKNDILMYRTASAVLHLLSITGLYVFLPKYLENQFQMATHNANFISGTFGILMMGVGIFIAGVISVKFSLSARKVAMWIAFTALITVAGMLTLSLIGCPMDNFKGLETRDEGGPKIFVPHCFATNSTCLCDDTKYAPVCGSDGLSYMNPCAAGCKLESELSGKRNFSEYSCIETESYELSTTTNGLCDNGRCDMKLKIFIAIFAFTVFIHSTSEVGGMLIIMRCTHPKDKAMASIKAMGIVQFSLGLLSNIPCPNIYARIIDATCIVWSKICGQNGHCSLYDSDSFRRYFFGVSCLIMILAFVMDIVVFFKSHRIDIDPESHIAKETNGDPTKDYGEENLLKLRKMSQDGDVDQHMKIAIRDEI